MLPEGVAADAVGERDLRNETAMEIGWEAGRAFVKVPPGGN
jgi:hypothetical protein